MDFEKAYKEALERAKGYLKEYYFEEAVKDIFPELAGSEDEKVRKEIVEYLKKNLRLEWATWLEKQGEQKPIEWDEYDEVYVSALIAIVEKDGATGKNLRDGLTGKNLRDELIGWLRCLKGRFLKR